MSEEEIVNRLYELMSDMNPGNLGPQDTTDEFSSSDFRASEPMNLAFRLLKEEDEDWEDEDWEEEEEEIPHYPWDDREEVTAEELLQEAKLLQESGHGAAAKRFVAVARSMQKPDEIRERNIERYAVPIRSLQDLDEDQHLSELLYDEKGPFERRVLTLPRSEGGDRELYEDDTRRRLLQLFRRMFRGQEREQQARDLSNEQLLALQSEDPTKFFQDREMKLWEEQRNLRLPLIWGGNAPEAGGVFPAHMGTRVRRTKKKSSL